MGLTFNNIHSSVYGLGTKITRPLLPGNSDNYIDIPGRAGSILYTGKPKDRLISVEFGFMPGSRELFRAKVWEISAWLNTDDRKILIFDDEPDKYYMAKVEGQIDLEQVFVLGKFSVIFRCEPLAYGAEQSVNFVNDSITINNQGTFESQPVFTSTFTTTEAEWKVTDPNSNYIRVINSFQVDDILEINTATGAIYINGIRALDKLDWQNSRFFSLRVGESTLTISPAGACTTRVSWIPKYL